MANHIVEDHFHPDQIYEGFIIPRFPNMTSLEKANLPLLDGMTIYDTDAKQLETVVGGVWVKLA